MSEIQTRSDRAHNIFHKPRLHGKKNDVCPLDCFSIICCHIKSEIGKFLQSIRRTGRADYIGGLYSLPCRSRPGRADHAGGWHVTPGTGGMHRESDKPSGYGTSHVSGSYDGDLHIRLSFVAACQQVCPVKADIWGR